MDDSAEWRGRRVRKTVAWTVAFVAGAASCQHGGAACDNQPTGARAEPDDPPAAAASAAAGVDWKAPIIVASGAAERGPWRMNQSRFHYVDDPTVAIEQDGRTVVAWVDNRAKDVYLQAYDRAGRPQLREPTNVSKSPDVFSWLPRIVTDGDDVFVLWQEIVFSGGSHGGEIFFARSDSGGHRFADPINLSNTTAGAGKGRLTEKRWHNGSLDLERGPDGTLYAAWTEYQGPLRFSRSTDGGRRFSLPSQVAGSAAAPVRGPSLAVSKDGTIYLAWAVGEDPSADIFVSRSTDQGKSFSPAREVATSAGHSDAPSLGVDSDGTLHLAYAESPGGMFERYHVRYTSSRDGARTFSPPQRISGTALDDQGAGFPSLELGGSRRLYVLWEHYPDYDERPRGLGFTSSADGGASFAPPSPIPGTNRPELGFNGSLQGLLTDKLAVHPSRGLAVVNSRFRPHDESVVRLILGHPAFLP